MQYAPNIDRKKKYSKRRATVLIGVYLLMGIHIVHWKITGKTLAPLEFNEVLYTLHLGIITAGFIFMGIMVIGTIFFGRFFCSWGCHMLALQDLSAWILDKLHIKPRIVRSRAFFLVPIALVIYLFVVPQIELLFNSSNPVKFKLLNDTQGWASFVTHDYWRNLPGIPVTIITFLVCGFVIIYFLGTRSFCQQICPYGVLFAIGDRLAPGKIKLTGDCSTCPAICTTHCTSHILVHKEMKEFGKVVNSNCLKDLDCVAVCPNDAIKYGFTKPSFFKSLATLPSYKRHYNFSLAEDVSLVFFILTFITIYRGLYNAIPFLLAATIAVLLAYFTLVFIRLIKRDYVKTGNYILKQDGKFSQAGKYFCCGFLIVLIFSAHSAVVRYHTIRGEWFYNKITSSNKIMNTSVSKKTAYTARALFHLKQAQLFGFFTTAALNRELASLYLLTNDNYRAKQELQSFILKQPNDQEGRLKLAKLYVAEGDAQAAITELQQIINADDRYFNRDERNRKSDAYVLLGYTEKAKGNLPSAMSNYENAIRINAENAEAMMSLSLIYIHMNRLKDAELLLLKCNKLFPENPTIHSNLSWIYIKTNDFPLAITHLQKLIQLQPANVQAHQQLEKLLGKK
ncbi:MAG: tetratricopeptide repeat protein [Bacteroidia bacterium]|nr:tetratricopeptide repeat protein [Bacteroidia bacterium]